MLKMIRQTYKSSMSSSLFNKNWLVAKRCLDIFISLTCLLLFSPVILLIALTVILDSPGNPFFVQKRVGRNGGLFNIFKIRTLYLKHFGILPGEEPEDYRITRIGKYLRRSKLDELPQ